MIALPLARIPPPPGIRSRTLCQLPDTLDRTADPAVLGRWRCGFRVGEGASREVVPYSGLSGLTPCIINSYAISVPQTTGGSGTWNCNLFFCRRLRFFSDNEVRLLASPNECLRDENRCCRITCVRWADVGFWRGGFAEWACQAPRSLATPTSDVLPGTRFRARLCREPTGQSLPFCGQAVSWLGHDRHR